MILPRCESLVIRTGGGTNSGLQGCGEPAEYWDCSEPIGGPVCFVHACKLHSKDKLGIKLDATELAKHVARQERLRNGKESR